MICDILIVGGDGDLAYRKLYPALYHLDQDGCLPDCLKVVGIARTEGDNETFRSRVKEKFTRFQSQPVDDSIWIKFAPRLHYMAVDATTETGLLRLRDIYFTDKSRDLIVYLATPPSIFASVCQSLWAVGLVQPSTRIVVEKPLGNDLQSFRDISTSLSAIFQEQQVYRIDHYLGKETVQNLLAMRFANALFEPLWNNNYIDHVQITVAETIGIEGRWEFYDEAGAMRDMVQNHLLQLLCLLTMEPPTRLDSQFVHEEKLKVLRALKPMSKSDVKENTVRGQYQKGAVNGDPVPGYLEEEGARPDSGTETFVALKAQINNWRWTGVPFYLRTGKRMINRYSEIVIQFKQVPHAIFGEQMAYGEPNRLIIRLQPEEGIQLMLMNKAPGLDEPMLLEPVSLNLSLCDNNNRRMPGAYERLLFDVMRENSTLFMRTEQLEAAWAWVDEIIEGWQLINKSPAGYTAGSWGPLDAVALIARDGRNWYEG